MAEQKHTRGSWKFEDGFILANGEALKVVGVQVPTAVGPSRLEAIANARLIAASPEFAAGVEMMITHEEGGGGGWWEGWAMLKAAFRKAGLDHSAPWFKRETEELHAQSQGTPA